MASFKATLEEARQARLLLHVVDASSPAAEEQIKAVKTVLDEVGCSGKPTLLVLNKIDRLVDLSLLHVLQKHHPRAVAISAARRQGVDELADAVIEALSADFAEAEVTTSASNGRVQAYLSAHAEIYRQQFRDDQVVIHCQLPKHLLHHIQGPDVEVRFLNGEAPATE